MPYTQQRAEPRFPALIIGLGRIAVQMASGVATISLLGDDQEDPNVSQYLRALNVVRANGAATLDQSVGASLDDPNRIVLNFTRTVPFGGAFETLVKTTFSFSDDTITALRALAVQQLP